MVNLSETKEIEKTPFTLNTFPFNAVFPYPLTMSSISFAEKESPTAS